MFTQLALFPLPLVAFPGCRLPLQIFEPRYLDLVKSSLAAEQPFGVVTVDSEGTTHRQYEPPIKPVGTAVRIVDFNHQSNGLLGIVCEGQYKFTVQDVGLAEDKLLHAGIEVVETEPECVLPAGCEELVSVLMRLFEHDYVKAMGYRPEFDPDYWFEHLHELSWTLAYLLPLPVSVKYQWLEMIDPAMRLISLRDTVARLQSGAQS